MTDPRYIALVFITRWLRQLAKRLGKLAQHYAPPPPPIPRPIDLFPTVRVVKQSNIYRIPSKLDEW